MASELAAEIGTKAPAEAQPFADLLAAAAVQRWPANPRLFAWIAVAVGERESHWKDVRGADGHGCGYMQIDDRAWKQWCLDHDAFDPAQNIPEGELILTIGLKWFPNNLRAAIAAYNCGPGNVERALKDSNGTNPDLYTTGNDYGADVLRRLAAIKPADLVVPA